MKLIDKITSITIASGTISLLSSLLMAVLIPRVANGGLSTPYRRIIFGLSVSDIIQSLAIVLGPFFVPRDETSFGSSWAIGNVHTCDFQGFIFTFGATTTCMYTLFLCLYYYCKLKRNISDSAFKKKIETKIHCFIVLFNLVVCSIALATKTFNPLPGIGSCQIMRKPLWCDPSVPGSCERGKYANLFGLVYFPVAIPCICLIGTLVFMLSIVVHVVKRDPFFRLHCGSAKGRGTGEEEETEADRVARLLRREVALQVILYVLAFLLTYGWAVPLSSLSRANKQTALVFTVIIVFFIPLLGLFNILIYTRPQIVAYRRLHRDVSWPVAFWRVLKAGGENPDSTLLSPTSDQTGCCQGICCIFLTKYESRNVPSGISRLRKLRQHIIDSPPSELLMQQHLNEPNLLLSDTSTEDRAAMELSSLQCDADKFGKDGDCSAFDALNLVPKKGPIALGIPQEVISKAFEKASRRAGAMNLMNGIAEERKSYSEISGGIRCNSRWSDGASQGSCSVKSMLHVEVDNRAAMGNIDDSEDLEKRVGQDQ